MFDEPDGSDAGATAESTAPGDSNAPSAEWQAANAAIASDMRAHLKRRKKVRITRAPVASRDHVSHPHQPLICPLSQSAKADLIKQNRGPIAKVLFGMGDFLRSRYFANVRKSVGVFVGMWLWYVLNTKTYIPPEIEE